MVKKCIYIILTCSLCIFLLSNNIEVLAGNAEGTTQSGKDGKRSRSDENKGSSSGKTGDDIITGANSFIEDGEKEVGDALNQEELVLSSNSIYNILLAIAMIVAVAVGIALGIKYMISSVDEQAKTKEMLVAYVAGCIVVFGAMGIWKLAVTTFSKF